MSNFFEKECNDYWRKSMKHFTRSLLILFFVSLPFSQSCYGAYSAESPKPKFLPVIVYDEESKEYVVAPEGFSERRIDGLQELSGEVLQRCYDFIRNQTQRFDLNYDEVPEISSEILKAASLIPGAADFSIPPKDLIAGILNYGNSEGRTIKRKDSSALGHEVLDLSKNHLLAPPPFILQEEFSALRELDLSGNCLTFLPDCLAQLPNLMVLNVSNNHFCFFPRSLLHLSKRISGAPLT